MHHLVAAVNEDGTTELLPMHEQATLALCVTLGYVSLYPDRLGQCHPESIHSLLMINARHLAQLQERFGLVPSTEGPGAA